MDAPQRDDGRTLVGIDEVGIGCLAGPVVAAAVILDPANAINGITDSKKISENVGIQKGKFLDFEYSTKVISKDLDEIEKEVNKLTDKNETLYNLSNFRQNMFIMLLDV